MAECRFAQKLTELRTLRGLTQTELAQNLSVSNKTVSKWENGTTSPDLSAVVDIAEFFGVTTDVLLGVSEEGTKSTKEAVSKFFEGLNRRESIIKAFDTVRNIIPAVFHKFVGSEALEPPVFDTDLEEYLSPRSNISNNNFVEFVASSESANIAVMMLKNRANFLWMKDPEKQSQIARFFAFLSKEDALSVMYFIHSEACSENFTADFVSANTGVEQERVLEILDEFCLFGECTSVTAHLEKGEVKVYECWGDGVVLASITLAYEKMCGKKCYHYNVSGNCKMIGGE